MMKKAVTTAFVAGGLLGIAATAAVVPMVTGSNTQSMMRTGKRAIRRYVNNML